jgi:hypothetical protein
MNAIISYLQALPRGCEEGVVDSRRQNAVGRVHIEMAGALALSFRIGPVTTRRGRTMRVTSRVAAGADVIAGTGAFTSRYPVPPPGFDISGSLGSLRDSLPHRLRPFLAGGLAVRAIGTQGRIVIIAGTKEKRGQK